MSQINWIGGAPAVAQVTEVTVGGTLSGETFTISVNDEVIATHTDSTTVIADTVAALVAAWNASTVPYAIVVTASDSSPKVILTSDVEGMPFEITLNTPGGSATFSQATPTASEGPNHFDTDENWSTGSVPADGDEYIVDDPDARILWGLDQSGKGFDAHLNSFSMIGLRRDVFVTSADGSTWAAERPEYRQLWLHTGFASLHIGKQTGSAVPAIGRCKIKHEDGSPSVVVHHTGNASLDPQMPAIRFLTDSLSTTDGIDILIEDAPGGVGFGVDGDLFDQCILGDVKIRGATSKVYYYVYNNTTGTDLWWDEWIQEAGTSYIFGGNLPPETLPAMIINGGTCYLEPNMKMTALTVDNGAIVYDRNVIATGVECITVNLNRGGTLDMTGSKGAKAYTTLNWEAGATLVRNDKLTVTTENLPADQDYTMALS